MTLVLDRPSKSLGISWVIGVFFVLIKTLGGLPDSFRIEAGHQKKQPSHEKVGAFSFNPLSSGKWRALEAELISGHAYMMKLS